MSEIDQITINFSENNLLVINFFLGFLTFGVALDIYLKDFRKIFKQPKKILIGLTSQLILLPIYTILLIYLANPIPSIILGLALVAACPGGPVSNYATHVSKGNTALSLTLTSIITVLAIITTPITFTIISNIFPSTRALLQTIKLDAVEIFLTILQVILVPLAIGIWLNNQKPKFVNKIRKPVKITSMIIFIILVIGALIANIKIIIEHLHIVFFLVIVHNLVAHLIGYFFAKANNLPEADCRALSIETGIQNAGLGLVIIFSFFKKDT